MFHTWAGAAVRERIKCALEDLNVKSESVLQSKGQTTMPVRGRENKRERVANNRLYRGTRLVEVDEIIGSVGRWRDFDRSFLPARASVGHKWKRIERAFHRAEDLPSVKLYEIGYAYFVVDGQHRDSVARYHYVPAVEATVVEFHPKRPAAPVPITSEELVNSLGSTIRRRA